MSSQNEKLSVLFVCLGNTCRSTMAEGVFRFLIKNPAYASEFDTVDSCGTVPHTGDKPNRRTMITLEDYGITDYEHTARKIQAKDFATFDYIFAMDRSNLRDLEQLQQRHGGDAKIMLFGEFAGEKEDGEKVAEEVQDPYSGGQEGYEIVFKQCEWFSKNFLRRKPEGEGGKDRAGE